MDHDYWAHGKEECNWVVLESHNIRLGGTDDEHSVCLKEELVLFKTAVHLKAIMKSINKEKQGTLVELGETGVQKEWKVLLRE